MDLLEVMLRGSVNVEFPVSNEHGKHVPFYQLSDADFINEFSFGNNAGFAFEESS